MCELFGMSATNRQVITPYLIEFYSHSDHHPHGWGLATANDGQFDIEIEPECATQSKLLPHVLKDLRACQLAIAHIRKATVGAMGMNNTHPFVMKDYSGRCWCLAHNGTIFHSDLLGRFQTMQRGETDSERILLYLIHKLNEHFLAHDGLSDDDCFHIIQTLVEELSEGNKLNLLVTDGRHLYVHTNMENTLYAYQDEHQVMVSTVPLSHERWEHVPLNTLLCFKDGLKVKSSQPHAYEYIPEEELPWDLASHHLLVDVRTQESYIDQVIYNKYFIPTQRQPKDYVGIEFEFPIVHLGNLPVDFGVVHEMTEQFIKDFAFDHIKRDDDGYIYTAYSSLTGDDLSFDCSYNTLELSFGKESNLNVLYERFKAYYSYINAFFASHDHTLTGMGINPNYACNINEPIASERYRMLYHHLSSYEKYPYLKNMHHFPNFGMFSCASQVQMDVGTADVAATLNLFNKLEPLKTLLFANSYWQEDGDYLCVRDHLWRDSLHGYNKHNVDMYDGSFHDNDEVISYIKSMSIYCTERGGKYINFQPMTLRDYFASEKIIGEYYDGHRYQTLEFTPLLEDLQFLRSFKFEDLTFRGTIEFRSICEQPVSDIMTPAAFHAGLMNKIREVEAILEEDEALYHKGFTVNELRDMLNGGRWPSFLNKQDISQLIIKVLDVAKEGLQERGYHEEHFLTPLYQRAKTLTSPAKKMAAGLAEGKTMTDFINAYAEL